MSWSLKLLAKKIDRSSWKELLDKEKRNREGERKKQLLTHPSLQEAHSNEIESFLSKIDCYKVKHSQIKQRLLLKEILRMISRQGLFYQRQVTPSLGKSFWQTNPHDTHP